MINHRTLVLLASLLVTLTCTCEAVGAQAYQVYDLGPSTAALQISANKTVSGRIGTAGGIWTYNALTDSFTNRNLGNPANSTWCQGYGVNDAGQAAATAGVFSMAFNVMNWENAFRYSAGKWSNLTSKLTQSEGMAINAIGNVVGTCTSSNGFRATIWQGSKRFTLAGIGSDGYAMAINDSGTIAGFISYHGQPFVWRPNSVNGVTGGPVAFPLAAGRALGLHNNGDVVGDEVLEIPPTGPIKRQAFYWQSGAPTVTRIGTLYKNELGESLGSSIARGVNSAGQIVGVSDIDGTGLTHAFLWDRATGELTDLNALLNGLGYGSTITEVTRSFMIVDVPQIAINDSGWICLTAKLPDNTTRGYVLKPL